MSGPHRSALQSVNGGLDNGQRFGIDWMRLDDSDRFVAGDPSVVRNWAGYDEPVLAVAAGVVIATGDGLPDQPPGQLPDPATITLQTVDGNHVVIDIGGGLFVFYAHLKKGAWQSRPATACRRAGSWDVSATAGTRPPRTFTCR